MSKETKLQLRIQEDLRESGEKLAIEYGLSSYQELIRFWTKQALNGNLHVSIHNDVVPGHLALEYDRDAKEILKQLQRGELKSFTNAKDLLADIEENIRNEDDQIS